MASAEDQGLAETAPAPLDAGGKKGLLRRRYCCPACAQERVEPHDAMLSDLMKASAHAFRSARIAPG